MKALAQLVRICGLVLCLCVAKPSAAQPPMIMPPGPPAMAMMGGNSAPVRVAVPGNIFARLDKGSPTGIFLEALDALLKRTGMTPTYITMPTSDALKDIKEGSIGVATVVVPVSAIQDAFYFSNPIVTEYNVVVALKDNGFKLGKISDLHRKTIGARLGYQYPLLEKDPDIRFSRFRSDGEMLRALLFGQTDVALIAGISDISAFRTEGIMTRLEILKTAVGTVPLVVAFSKKQFTKERVDAFNQALASFKQGPEWLAILEKNGLADLVKEWPLVME